MVLKPDSYPLRPLIGIAGDEVLRKWQEEVVRVLPAVIRNGPDCLPTGG